MFVQQLRKEGNAWSLLIYVPFSTIWDQLTSFRIFLLEFLYKFFGQVLDFDQVSFLLGPFLNKEVNTSVRVKTCLMNLEQYSIKTKSLLSFLFLTFSSLNAFWISLNLLYKSRSFVCICSPSTSAICPLFYKFPSSTYSF